ncbi:MAG TPA: hypothetical protein VEJ67_05090 [Candidatus Cybelea sp.]|nr:hypothetical protein [Candidatus Cybelea sp.]
MSSGFNTDIRVGERVFHVQTEDRGPSRPVIDTMVYHSGRVLHRRSSNYSDFRDSAEFSHDALHERVQQQHKTVIEDLRSGRIGADPAAPVEPNGEKRTVPEASTGIQVQLLNPESWLTAGTISLNVEILRRSDQQPERGAQVEALIEGSLDEACHAGTTDAQGRAQILFPMPRLGKGGLALVIRAKAEAGVEDLRFVIRSNPKPLTNSPS